MKSIIFACLLAVAVALPVDEPQFAQVVRDDRVHPEGGAYSVDVETDNGIKFSEGGQPDEETGAIETSGTIEFTFPNGEVFVMKYVADKLGYKPESTFLPVAPLFPHEIPAHALNQIAFAEQQLAARA